MYFILTKTKTVPGNRPPIQDSVGGWPKVKWLLHKNFRERYSFDGLMDSEMSFKVSTLIMGCVDSK